MSSKYPFLGSYQGHFGPCWDQDFQTLQEPSIDHIQRMGQRSNLSSDMQASVHAHNIPAYLGPYLRLCTCQEFQAWYEEFVHHIQMMGQCTQPRSSTPANLHAHCIIRCIGPNFRLNTFQNIQTWQETSLDHI